MLEVLGVDREKGLRWAGVDFEVFEEKCFAFLKNLLGEFDTITLEAARVRLHNLVANFKPDPPGHGYRAACSIGVANGDDVGGMEIGENQLK